MLSTENLLDVLQKKTYNKMICTNFISTIKKYFRNRKDFKRKKFSISYSYKVDNEDIRIFISETGVKYSVFNTNISKYQSFSGCVPKYSSQDFMNPDEYFNKTITEEFPDIVLKKNHDKIVEFFKTSKIRHFSCIEDVVDESFDMFNKYLYPNYL
ncbi:hypothetical protein XaC1_455 [Xanthomonas phage XaC1]|nr:hypothetical protein XaC1_455 [Xanthomonas phage XaC1]